VTAAIAKDNLMVVRFHPEKSCTTGLLILSIEIDWLYALDAFFTEI
jgi:imidazoleglycerol phosphate synthase glutamine amidotransferase subunit HisH